MDEATTVRFLEELDMQPVLRNGNIIYETRTRDNRAFFTAVIHKSVLCFGVSAYGDMSSVEVEVPLSVPETREELIYLMKVKADNHSAMIPNARGAAMKYFLEALHLNGSYL